MKKHDKTLKFQSEIIEVEDINPLFSKVKIKIAYPGKNRNNSYISKESFEKALPTIYNCPIIGEFYEEANDFGDHGGKIIIDSNGIKWVNTTIPYGVINDNTEITWEEITEKDGTINTYLCATGYIWSGRYPELQNIINKSHGQSMEIEIVNANWIHVDGEQVYNIEDFIFSGFCILGSDVEPCFENASISVYSINYDEFKQQFNTMLKELRFSLEKSDFIKKDDFGSGEKIDIDLTKEAADFDTPWGSVNKTTLRNKILKAKNYKTLVKKCYLMVKEGWEDNPSEKLKYPVCMIKDNTLILSAKGCQTAFSYLEKNTDDPDYASAKRKLKKYYQILDLDTSNFSLEGGNKVDEKLELLKKYNFTQEMLAEKEIDIEQISIEELEQKLIEFTKNDGKSNSNNFELTAQQLKDELKSELGKEKVKDDWGYEWRRYWYVDHTDTMVFAEDSEDDWKIYGFNYSMNGDKPVIDFESKKRMKIEFVPFEGEDSVEFTLGSIERMETLFEHKKEKEIEELKTEFSKEKEESVKEVQTKYDELQNKFNELENSNKELLEFKENIIKEQRENAENELFEQFSTQLDEEELNLIKENKDKYTIEELEKELLIAVGRKNTKFTKTKKDTVKIKISDGNNDYEPYGSLSIYFQK